MRVAMADSGDKVGVSRLTIDGVERAGIGRVGVGEEIWFTNLILDSS